MLYLQQDMWQPLLEQMFPVMDNAMELLLLLLVEVLVRTDILGQDQQVTQQLDNLLSGLCAGTYIVTAIDSSDMSTAIYTLIIAQPIVL
jgi:hypothetical protein